MTKSTSSEVEINVDLNGFLPLLQRLDRLIQQAIDAIQISEGESKPAWLEQTATSEIETAPIRIRADSPLAWLQQKFALSVFDLDILAIALAPELDRQYLKIYAYLQAESALSKPTVDLALSLLCTTTREKLFRRQHFATSSPLISHRLLDLYSGSAPQPTILLEKELILDEQVIRLLLQEPGLDRRLISCCELSPSISDRLSIQPTIKKALTASVLEAWQTESRLFYFSGCDRPSKLATAENLAKTLEVSLLVVDLEKAIADKFQFEDTLRLALREADFFTHLLYLANFDSLYLHEHQALYQTCLKVLKQYRGIAILGGVEPWKPAPTGNKGLINLDFAIPEASQRRDCWQTQLQLAQISLEDRELDLLSDRFSLTAEQIADAVITAKTNIRWQSLNKSSQGDQADTPGIFLNLCNAARTQSSLDLGNLAYQIEPKYTWNDIVLHRDRLQQLKAVCKELEYRHLVHHQWGFGSKLSLGKGINVLFCGASGTGKTMAAEVIANQLQLDLYKIDLSQIISKYIGETEKNLNRIFTAATNSNAILLFDEADALFGKRSQVQDARDRYANIEVGYLLQKMEEYPGITILTTNLRDNIDKAFERRLRFIIKFSLPEAPSRHLIWQKTLPKNAPCRLLDLEFLAQNLEISGASIRNIALTAAFLAADDDEIIEMSHIIKATQQEYQKIGKVLRNKELDRYLN